MRNIRIQRHFVLFLCLISGMGIQFSSLKAFALESCGFKGSISERQNDCYTKNKESFNKTKNIGFYLVTHNPEVGSFYFDYETEYTWSPIFQKKKLSLKRKCKWPYKKAKRSHYKKVTAKFFKKQKGFYHCISKLKKVELIPQNKYLLFKKRKESKN
jgi:hypothetical protein